MAEGTITTLTERGFGFIRPSEGSGDVFFHRSVLDGVAFEELRPGDAVTYTVGPDRHRPGVRATAVRRPAGTSPAEGREETSPPGGRPG